MKIFVGVPAYDGRVLVQTARALSDERVLAASSGIDMAVHYLTGGSLITTARDQLVDDFMKSDADRLVFVDADVSWEIGDLLRLASHPVDFVGGCYRYKRDEEAYPILYLDKDELWADPATGLLEVHSLPAGFLCLTKTVFERLKARFPERSNAYLERDMHAYFWAPPGGGEDGMLCNEWRSIGGQVWLDPRFTLTHTGGNPDFTGNIGNWLRSR